MGDGLISVPGTQHILYCFLEGRMLAISVLVLYYGTDV